MTAPKAHGILMRDEMSRGLLRPPSDPLHKSVTRRTSDQWARRKVGDLLWVRECWRWCGWADWSDYTAGTVGYRADNAHITKYPDVSEAPAVTVGWKPGIHMPRWASRTLLRVTDLRREHCAPSSVTHRWVGEGPPDPQPTAVWLYGPEMNAHRGAVPGYAVVPHWGEPLPWVDDAEARREGVEDRAAYLRLFEAINGDAYPTWVWRIAFERVE